MWPFIEVITVFVASLCITHLLRRFLARCGVLDTPNARSSHSKPLPRGGGLSIALTFLPALLVLWLRGVLSSEITAAIVGGGVLIAGVGLADDLWSLPIWVRALTHLAAASWAISRLGRVGPLLPGSFIGIWGWAGPLVAVIGLVWMINLYNFMDGIDALGGLEAVTAGSLGSVLLSQHGRPDLAQVALLLAFASAGFLVWNWPPAKIFMGDVGSGFLGFVFGVLIIAGAKGQPPLVWPWLILMGAFVVDATITLIRRLIRGDRWYAAHRSHAYQRASRLWHSHTKVTVSIGLLNLVWLFPLAWWAAASPALALPLAFAAFLPLVWVALYLRAGEREALSKTDL
jgi:Fuc2NAc and GlcNAc transferase